MGIRYLNMRVEEKLYQKIWKNKKLNEEPRIEKRLKGRYRIKTA